MDAKINPSMCGQCGGSPCGEALFCETPIICFSGGWGTDGGGWVPTARLSGGGWDIWASGALTQNHEGFRGTLGIPERIEPVVEGLECCVNSRHL